MSMYLRCGRQYFYRYAEGIKNPPAVALVEGGSHHSVFEVNNKYKMKTGKDKKPDTLAGRFADEFSDRAKEIPKREWRFANETKDSVIVRGRKLQKLYGKNIAPIMTPEFAEFRIEMRVGVVDVVGIIDVGGKWSANKVMQIKKGKGLMDYKVVGKAMSRGELEGIMSLSFYGWSCLSIMKGLNFSNNPPDVGFCALKKTQTPAIQWQTVPLRVSRVKWFRRLVLSIADSISRGSFPLCDPTHWCCSERFCGYWHKCRGKIK